MKSVVDCSDLITHEELLNVIKYIPETGSLIWIKCLQKSRIGKEAGWVSCNHKQINIKGRTIFAHRLIFFYMTGRWPDGFIDHKDGDGLNNKWENLRECSHVENMQNRKKHKNRNGLKGAYRDRNGWISYIRKDGVSIYLGRFPTENMAHDAYKKASEKFHGEFGRVG